MKGLLRTNHSTIVAQKQCSSCPYVMRHVDKRRQLCSACRAKMSAEQNQTSESRLKRQVRQEELETARLAQVLDELFAIRAYTEGV